MTNEAMLQMIAKLQAENAQLKEQLEAEQEWKEDESTYRGEKLMTSEMYAEYTRLVNVGKGHYLTDEEATQLIVNYLEDEGFLSKYIRIRHEKDYLYTNRHNDFRAVKGDCRPIKLDDWGCHFIAFEYNDTMLYELIDGEVVLF